MKTVFSKVRVLCLIASAALLSIQPMALVAKAASVVYGFMTGLVAPQATGGMMAYSNTLTGLMPTLYEALDTVSRELVGMIPAVSADSTIDRAAKGQVVMSYVTPAVTASDVTPGVTAPNDGDQVIGNIPVTITKSRYVPVRWSGEESKGVNTGPGTINVMRDQFAQAFRTLTNEIEADLATSYKFASRAVGTPGTAPFGTNGDLTDFANARQVLEDNGAPTSALRYVAGSAAIANLRGKQAVLFRVNESGSDELLRQGVVGQVEGLMVGNSAQVRKLSAVGTGNSYVSSGTYAIGATAITLATGTGTVLAGDVVTFTGDTNRYVVASGVAAPGVVTIAAPGLRQALGTGVAMAISAIYTPNLAFAKTAIVLATRMPATPMDAQGRSMDMADDRTTIVDPFSGIAFEVALYRQYRQIKYEISLAWGFGCVKPEHICIGQG